MTQPDLPTNTRLYAVGDIHGRDDLLGKMLQQITADAVAHPDCDKKIIFLGDYIDRGMQPRTVLQMLSQLKLPGFEIIFLRGNHEDALMRFIAGDLTQGTSWLQFGGVTTLASYGINALGAGSQQNLSQLQFDLLEKMPGTHIAFLDGTQFSYSCGTYHFVHAGIRPGVPLDKQDINDLLWIRYDFLRSTADHGKIIIHGHTITPDPDIRRNRIGIDTGAYATGKLTCLVLAGSEQKFLVT